jgi:glutathione S-transferase
MSILVGQRIVRPHLGLPPEPAIAAAAERDLALALAPIDRQLAAAPYLAGASFSLADISLMPYIAATHLVAATAALADLRHLQRWWSDVSARPSWRAVAGS